MLSLLMRLQPLAYDARDNMLYWQTRPVPVVARLLTIGERVMGHAAMRAASMPWHTHQAPSTSLSAGCACARMAGKHAVPNASRCSEASKR